MGPLGKQLHIASLRSDPLPSQQVTEGCVPTKTRKRKMWDPRKDQKQREAKESNGTMVKEGPKMTTDHQPEPDQTRANRLFYHQGKKDSPGKLLHVLTVVKRTLQVWWRVWGKNWYKRQRTPANNNNKQNQLFLFLLLFFSYLGKIKNCPIKEVGTNK